MAVDIDNPKVLDELQKLQTILIGSRSDLKAVERENIHITLKFLGDINESLLEETKSVVTTLRFSPFLINLSEIGAFPNLGRPRIIWAGISEGENELSKIFRELEDALDVLGFNRERRRFSPHVTIARVRSGKNRRRLIETVLQNKDVAFGDLMVDRVKLKRSILTSKGPIYSTLAESRLEG
jgi:2'-5' RNA ligase